MHSRYILFSFCLISLSAVFIYSTTIAAIKPEEIISIDQTDNSDHNDESVIWKLQPSFEGIESTIILSLAKPAQPHGLEGKLGGESQIQLDGMVVKRNFFSEIDATVKEFLSLTNLTDGEHLITLTVRGFEGKVHRQERKIKLNARPRIKLATQDKEEEIFNPTLTFSFFGEPNPYAGLLDIYLDEKPFKSLNIKPDQNHKPIELSDLIERKIYKADLYPGTHLMTITAYGLNGSVSKKTLPIIVKAQEPVISIKRTKNQEVEKIHVTYPASSNKILGTALIILNHSIILQAQTDKKTLLIPRAELLASLEKHNFKKESTTLIISTRTVNQVEAWQEMLFQ